MNSQLKLKEQYVALDKLHTKYVISQNWTKVAEVFSLMMEVSDRMYGKGRNA